MIGINFHMSHLSPVMDLLVSRHSLGRKYSVRLPSATAFFLTLLYEKFADQCSEDLAEAVSKTAEQRT